MHFPIFVRLFLRIFTSTQIGIFSLLSNSCYRKQPSMTLKSILRKTTVQYLRRSQIQCYKYVVATDRSLFERATWAVATISFLIMTLWLTISSYLELMEAPTVTNERTSRMPVVNISFPAVTFCSENRISRKALRTFAAFMYLLHPTIKL